MTIRAMHDFYDEFERQMDDIRRKIETWKDVDVFDAGSYMLINGNAGCVRVDHVDWNPYSIPDVSELLTEQIN